MLAAVCLTLLQPHQAPQVTLDVRDAPTAAVFAMMLGGNEVSVMRHFPAFVTLRLTETQITLPPPDSGRSTYGDYWPIAGWLARIDRAMGLNRLVVGYEREGGAFYVSEAGMPNDAGHDDYQMNPQNPSAVWHRVPPVGDGQPLPPPTDALPEGFRLAGVRWTEDPGTRQAILVVKSKSGESFTRLVKEGDWLSVGGFGVATIEPTAIVLNGLPVEPMRLELRGNR